MSMLQPTEPITGLKPMHVTRFVPASELESMTINPEPIWSLIAPEGSQSASSL